MDVRSHNRAAWNNHVEQRQRWKRPVTKELTERARAGKFDLFLTPTKSGAACLVKRVIRHSQRFANVGKEE